MEKKAVNFEKIAPLLGGGLLLGGGAGAAVALYKLMNRLNESRQKEVATNSDDDTLYLNVEQPDQEDLEKPAATGDTTSVDVLAGGVGGLLAAYLGYKGVDAIYNKVRQGRLQSELDEAQNIYLDRLSQSKQASMEKSAIGSGMDRMGAGMLGVPLLTAVGAALITNRIMSKANPKLKKPGKKSLRKIVVKSPPKKNKPNKKEKVEEVAEEVPSEVPTEAPTQTDVSNEDVQNLLALSMGKSASMKDMISTIAAGNFDEFKSNFEDFGLFGAIDMSKGASLDCKASDNEKLDAILKLASDTLMQDSVALFGAAEFYDMGPTLCKNASFLDENQSEALIDFNREFLRDARSNNFDKRAAATGVALALLQNSINDAESQDSDSGLQLGSSQDSSTIKERNDDEPDLNPDESIDGIHLDANDENAKAFIEKYRDIIDAALDVK